MLSIVPLLQNTFKSLCNSAPMPQQCYPSQDYLDCVPFTSLLRLLDDNVDFVSEDVFSTFDYATIYSNKFLNA